MCVKEKKKERHVTFIALTEMEHVGVEQFEFAVPKSDTPQRW